MDNKEVQSKDFFIWVSIYIILVTVLIELITFSVFSIHFMVFILTGVFSVLLNNWLGKKKLSKNILYLNNMNMVVWAVSIGYIASIVMSKWLVLFWGYLIYNAVSDFYSFTKSGENTTNAKLRDNNNTLARFSICLPVPNLPGLQPIIGKGDLLDYSIITITAMMVWGTKVFMITAIAIILGQAINVLIYIIFRNKKWYKGIPAVVLPIGLFIVTVVLK